MSPDPNFIPPVCLKLFICLAGSLATGGIKSLKHKQWKRDKKKGRKKREEFRIQKEENSEDRGRGTRMEEL